VVATTTYLEEVPRFRSHRPTEAVVVEAVVVAEVVMYH
jgi:hypothetical protein